MRRQDVRCLRYIAHVGNVVSIEQRGVLCHRDARRVRHVDIAAPEIQERRRRKAVPGGLALHRYANAYFNARNKMMYRVVQEQGPEDVCVVEVDSGALELGGAVISDQNAASNYARFYPSPAGLAQLNAIEIFAETWLNPQDKRAEWRLGSVMCAELLVPNRIAPAKLRRVLVPTHRVRDRLEGHVGLPVEVDPGLFFQEG